MSDAEDDPSSQTKPDKTEIYNCAECEQNFSGQGALACHQTRVHIPDTLFICVCGKTFERKGLLNGHKRRTKTCQLMEKEFPSDQSATVCSICGEKFSSKLLALHHNKNVHNLCFVCRTPFPTVLELREHKIQHHPKRPTKCPRCLAEVVYLKQHIKVVHSTKNENTVCGTCKKVFKNPTYAKRHARYSTKCKNGCLHTLESKPPDEEPESNRSTETPDQEQRYWEDIQHMVLFHEGESPNFPQESIDIKPEPLSSPESPFPDASETSETLSSLKLETDPEPEEYIERE